MQFLFKTKYEDDLRLLPKAGEKWRVGLLILLLALAPLGLGQYYLAELGLLLVYVIAGVGLMVLTGFTGQVSFGHAAFLGIGAYAHAFFLMQGFPFLLSAICSTVLCGLLGMALGRSASKMHGFYLAIATLAFLILVETVLGEWTSVTGGHAGLAVPELRLLGVPLTQVWQQYYLDLGIALLVLLTVANIMRSSTGRAFVAVRDSELSARCLGVSVEWVKIQAFGLSAAIVGLGGVLLAHHLTFLAPEVFGVQESLKLLLMIIVGGLGSLLGAIYGAVFVTILPVILSFLKDVLPPSIGHQAGLELLLFGSIIVLFIIFEPEGMAGRWRKIRYYFETFPYYRRASFLRQKSYLKTERMR